MKAKAKPKRRIKRRTTVQMIQRRWRDTSTDAAIIGTLTELGGEAPRRELARRFGMRPDFAAALHALSLRRNVECLSKLRPGRRPLQVVRLTGPAAVEAGVGFVRFTGAAT